MSAGFGVDDLVAMLTTSLFPTSKPANLPHQMTVGRTHRVHEASTLADFSSSDDGEEPLSTSAEALTNIAANRISSDDNVPKPLNDTADNSGPMALVLPNRVQHHHKGGENEVLVNHVPENRVSASSRVLRPPRTVLFLGGAGTGKSNLINAIRFCSNPKVRFQKCTVGVVGRHGTQEVDYFTDLAVDEQAVPRWVFVDTPGRLYPHANELQSDDDILLTFLTRGLPARTKLIGRDAKRLDELDHERDSNLFLSPEQVVFTVKATDLVEERVSWLGVQRRYFANPTCSDALQYIADVVDWLDNSTPFGAPHLVVTHMDKFVDPAAAEQFLRSQLACCPSTNQYYVGIPVEAFQPQPTAVSNFAVPQLGRRSREQRAAERSLSNHLTHRTVAELMRLKEQIAAAIAGVRARTTCQ